MTGIREHPPPGTGSAVAAAPAALAKADTRPGRVAGLDGIRGLAALCVVTCHIFLRAWPGYPGANHAPFWAALLSHGRGGVAMFIVLSGFSLGLGPARSGGGCRRPRRSRTDGPGASCRRTGPRSGSVC
jgi:uncharacterized membrane protein